MSYSRTAAVPNRSAFIHHRARESFRPANGAWPLRLGTAAVRRLARGYGPDATPSRNAGRLKARLLPGPAGMRERHRKRTREPAVAHRSKVGIGAATAHRLPKQVPA